MMKKSTTTIKIGHLNVFHLTNKIPDVCNLLNTSTRTHIFGICETKIHASTTIQTTITTTMINISLTFFTYQTMINHSADILKKNFIPVLQFTSITVYAILLLGEKTWSLITLKQFGLKLSNLIVQVSSWDMFIKILKLIQLFMTILQV